ncbi:hypothetical protein CGZ80_23715 [Rhodopirellula sp. MGV]|nr:hypothetical protein CGZ80_23715 [Rhodopirellula sp. MGV]PNY33692.1 hypothetical protein C2E31_26700 [Rhodopirellula baltica]
MKKSWFLKAIFHLPRHHNSIAHPTEVTVATNRFKPSLTNASTLTRKACCDRRFIEDRGETHA